MINSASDIFSKELLKGHVKYNIVLNSTWSFKSLEIPMFKVFTYNGTCMQIFKDVKLVVLCIIALQTRQT